MKSLSILCLALLAAPAAAQDNPAVIDARNDLIGGAPEAAMPVLLEAAEAGDMRAVALVGVAHERGLGVEPDMQEALRWYERAADLGYPRAIYFLGAIHRHGDGGVPVDLVRARQEMARAAAFDYPPALAEYGSMLTEGEGGPVEADLGVTYLEMAAAMGDSDGLAWLGMLHLEGRHVPFDEVEARRLFVASAALDNWGGQTFLGHMAELGLGGPQDLELAQENYAAAMGRGFDMAGAWMGRLIASHPQFDPRPLAAEAHCVWAQEIATKVAEPDGGWPAFCQGLLADLGPDEMAAARALAAEIDLL